MKVVYLFLILGLSFSACLKDEINDPVSDNSIIGNWSYPEYLDTSIIFTRLSILPENAYGINFLKSGKLLERKNSGSCGTPPIFYATYEGSWTQSGDTIQVTVPYWGGISYYTWIIESLENRKMRVTNHQYFNN
jgi:hypothetical protein